jgi:hypothetical protein
MFVSLKKKPAKFREERRQEREREREEVFEFINTKKNHPFSLSPSGAQHSKKENRECISPDQRRLYTALTRSIIQTPRWGEREEELVRLYRKNFKPRGEETAFEIYRKREREREHVRARETRDG